MKEKRYLKNYVKTNMEFKKILKKVTISALAAAMAVVPMGVNNVSAAQSDVINNSQTGSITIHKYDMTAAEAAGVNLDEFTSTGKQNTNAEEKLKKYAVKGVEFSYLRVGDVDQYSEAGKVKLIYEIPEKLQEIIGLDSDTAVKDGWYTSQSINDSLAKALEDNTAAKDKLEDYMKNERSPYIKKLIRTM